MLVHLAHAPPNAHERRIPILVVTGSTEDLEHLDVDCVVRKPISLEQLLEAVEKCVPPKR